MADIIAGDSSSNSRDGIARNAQIYDIKTFVYSGSSSNKHRLSKSLDHIVSNDIPVAMSSLGSDGSSCNDYSALTIVIDKAVDIGPIISLLVLVIVVIMVRDRL